MGKDKTGLKINKTITDQELDILRLTANTIRTLAMDAVQKANSGHPGMPMGMADVAAVLWAKYLNHNPKNPNWFNRDRFVLSAGHGSMLLYSLLHISGYDLPLSELKNFRQWNSKTPGHPEYGLTPGVETTTGPLGQGISNAVGMALAEKHLAAKFNQPGIEIINHFTYAIASDGDMMEGISHESCSLAAHLGLGKLIVLYDDNHISIDGSTDLSFSENVLQRFQAYGWHTYEVDGHNIEEVENVISKACKQIDSPSIIACRTTIGFGSPNKSNSAEAHGSPLGEEEIKLTKRNLDWPEDTQFYIPEKVKEYMAERETDWQDKQNDWEKLFNEYKKLYPDLAHILEECIDGKLPEDWDNDIPNFSGDSKLATRAASGKILDAISPRIPQLVGGSADLTPSNNTFPKNQTAISSQNFSGRYIHFGVREHGMGAILNGMALHGGIIPYGGTFLIFSDYMRGSIRLAALMKQKVIFVFSHDSIGLGEDGPTHQPVEQLTALRAIPGLTVIRPADAKETSGAWRTALTQVNGPTALIITRQKLPVLDNAEHGSTREEIVSRGAYIVADDSNPKLILIATGSEVHIALKAKELLSVKGIQSRVVSIPSFELFNAQPADYKETILPAQIKARVAVEAGVTLGWHKHTGDYGEIIGIDHFGASAPYEEIYKNFGITPETIADAALRSIERVNNHK